MLIIIYLIHLIKEEALKSQGRNAKLVKLHNRALVLRIIQQHGSISRKRISKLTKLTQATITKIATTLIDQKLILEQGQEISNTGSGRRPIALMINRERYKIISVYLGRSVLQGAVCDLAGNILYKTEEYKNLFSDPGRDIESETISFLDKIIEGFSVDISALLAISISAPGPINAKKGILLFSPDSSDKMSKVPFDWRQVNLSETLEKKYNVNVFTDNEANVSALGESWFGAGVGVNNFVLYSIGQGIGAGVVIDGMLYRGEDDVVSEIGHITIDYKGEKCVCGNIGCLEMYCSFIQLINNYYKKKFNSRIPEHLRNDTLKIVKEIETVFSAAYSGEQEAQDVILEIAHFLGIGAVSLANIFSPECIIVTGNDAGKANLDILIPIMQNSIRKGAFSVIANKVKVVNSKLGEDIHLYGGVALVLQDFFSQSKMGD